MSSEASQLILARFESATIEYFQFLVEDFGTTEPVVNRPDALTVDVQFANHTTGVQVSLELREQQLFVYIVRLDPEAQFPPYFKSADRWLYLDALARLVNETPPTPSLPLDRASIERAVKGHAAMLKRLAPEILNGDFAKFDAANAGAKGAENGH